MKIIGMCLLTMCLLNAAFAQGPQRVPDSIRAFNNKMFLSETPLIGARWRPQYRNTDVLGHEITMNFGDILSADILYAGIGMRTLTDTSMGIVTYVADNFSIFSIKTRPFYIPISSVTMAVGGGLKFFGSTFQFIDNLVDSTPIPLMKTGGVSAFVTANATPVTGLMLNLYAALQSCRTDGFAKSEISYYIIPAARYYVGPKKRWGIGAELYLMNPRMLPIKLSQITASMNASENAAPTYLDNYNKELFGMLLWGVSYQSRHVDVNLALFNHISFSGMLYPILSFGWSL